MMIDTSSADGSPRFPSKPPRYLVIGGPSSMASSLDIWNTVFAVLGLLAVICQLLYWTIKSRLPTARLRVLEDTLQETESLLSQCVEEGRLSDSTEVAGFYRQLGVLRSRANDLRVETLSAKTYADDVINMMKGLSRRTKNLCEEVRLARANISTSSSTPLHRSLDSGRTLTSPGEPSRCAESASLGEDSRCALFTHSSSHAPPTRPIEVANPSNGIELRPISAPPCRDVDNLGPTRTASWDSQMTLAAGNLSSGCASREDTASIPYPSRQPMLSGDRRKSVSSSRTTITQSLRRKKQAGIASRARALARLARLSTA
ncbi:hypothetical protein BV20DRAFT_60367 [Pilatotrama ljubarskyi]|nr:hypothetical protein BV20DRAFT_60367 [Pilatotrama ljubarskyi]